MDHDAFTYEHFQELWNHIHCGYFLVGHGTKPDKGHDFSYWARRIKNLRQMLQYLPQLVREWYVREEVSEYDIDEATGKPLFDYSEMPEPFFSMAFVKDAATPVTYEVESIEHTEEIKDYSYERNHGKLWYQPRYQTTFTQERRPVFYGELVQAPTKLEVTFDRNPMAEPPADNELQKASLAADSPHVS